MIVKPLKKASSRGTTTIITIPKSVLNDSQCKLGDNFSISSPEIGKIILERVEVSQCHQ